MRHLARAYAAASVVLVAVAAVTAPDLRWDAVPWAASCLLGSVAILVGVRVHRPRNRPFWLALVASDGLWALAAIAQLAGASAVSSSIFGAGSLLYLPGYIGLAVATVIVLRTTGGARPAPLEAAIGVFIAAAAVWPLTVHLLHAQGAAAAIVGSIYPAWDISLAVLLLRLFASPWFRLRSLRLLTLGMVGATFADIAYSSLLFESTLAARVSSVAYTMVYLLIGAAALPRSMRRLPPRRILDDSGANRRTLPVLAIALALAPLTFGIEEAMSGDLSGVAIAGIGLAASVLVIARVSTLLRNLNTLRRRAEASERLFRMIFDAAGVGISVGPDGYFERTNPALQRMLGYTAEELAGRHYTDFVHPDDVQLENVPRPGAVFTFERRYVHKDGDSIWAEVTLTAPDDNSFGIAVIDDTTASKRLEEDLRHAQKMEAVGQLAGGIAHDFNNLMTAVIGYAGMLRQELADSDPRRARAEAISGAAERAAELTRKLLAFSRRQVLRLEPLDIAAVVRGFDPILRPLLPETVAVEYDLEPGAVARVDRAELEQVLLNLSINARDAMPDGGRLTIAVGVVDDAVELVVADDGVGMTPETRSRIFDPFFTTKPVGQGTGLGLSTVDGIVAQLFGTVEVESEPGAGTTFRIRLPLAAAVLEEMPIATPAVSPRRGGTVLLVEDEEVVRHVTTEMLRLTGYGVVAASSAEEALTMLRAGSRPDVVVTDVVMTGMDGPTLAAQARSLLPDLPVLLVSGYPAETLGDRTTETVLTKPFTPAALAEHIELVRRAPVPA